MKKVSGAEVVATVEAPGNVLPSEIQEALGELVGAAREGLLALSVGVGLGVVHELMELEVTSRVTAAPSPHQHPARLQSGRTDRNRTVGRDSRERGRFRVRRGSRAPLPITRERPRRRSAPACADSHRRR